MRSDHVTLTSSNYDLFVHHIVRFSCTKLEQELLRKKFNQLGGLQFDKELRALLVVITLPRN